MENNWISIEQELPPRHKRVVATIARFGINGDGTKTNTISFLYNMVVFLQDKNHIEVLPNGTVLPKELSGRHSKDAKEDIYFMSDYEVIHKFNAEKKQDGVIAWKNVDDVYIPKEYIDSDTELFFGGNYITNAISSIPH